MKITVTLTDAQVRALVQAASDWYVMREGSDYDRHDRSTARALGNAQTVLIRARHETWKARTA